MFDISALLGAGQTAAPSGSRATDSSSGADALFAFYFRQAVGTSGTKAATNPTTTYPTSQNSCSCSCHSPSITEDENNNSYNTEVSEYQGNQPYVTVFGTMRVNGPDEPASDMEVNGVVFSSGSKAQEELRDLFAQALGVEGYGDFSIFWAAILPQDALVQTPEDMQSVIDYATQSIRDLAGPVLDMLSSFAWALHDAAGQNAGAEEIADPASLVNLPVPDSGNEGALKQFAILFFLRLNVTNAKISQESASVSQESTQPVLENYFGRGVAPLWPDTPSVPSWVPRGDEWNSDVTDSEITDPGMPVPELSEPTPIEPETALPELSDPGIAIPETPEIADPGVTIPESPEASIPDSPETVNPESLVPEIPAQEITDPETPAPELAIPEIPSDPSLVDTAPVDPLPVTPPSPDAEAGLEPELPVDEPVVAAPTTPLETPGDDFVLPPEEAVAAPVDDEPDGDILDNDIEADARITTEAPDTAPATENTEAETDSRDNEPEASFTNILASASPRTSAQPISTESQPAAPSAPQIIDQIASNLYKQSGETVTKLEMELNPATLGKISLALEHTRDGISVTLKSASDTVRQLLAGNMADLESALKNAGVNMKDLRIEQPDISWDFTRSGQWQNGSGSPASQQQNSRNHNRANPAVSRAAVSAAENHMAAFLYGAGVTQPQTTDTSLDIRA